MMHDRDILHAQASHKSALPARLRALIRDRRGETITEVLVAVLIGGLALIMFATAIASSFNIVRGGDEAMDGYYEFSNAFAANLGAGTSGTVTITDNADTSITGDASVTCYEWTDDEENAKVVSYTETTSGSGS